MSKSTSSLRITSGEAKNREIKVPKSAATHPMGDRERLALFNSLGPKLKGARVLDLYAGSGALGLEALSRGAEEAIFVEKNPKANQCIFDNSCALGYDDDAANLQFEVKMAMCTILYGEIFDIIFCDPPYDRFNLEDFIDVADCLDDDGVFVLSHPYAEAPDLPGLVSKCTKKYAAAHLSFYEKA